MKQIAIIGAGEAGIRAALTLRQLDADVGIHLFEQETGTPYERPPLSKEGLLQATFSRKHIVDLETLEKMRIVLHQNQTVVAIQAQSKQLLLNQGETFAYDKLLIATGARPRPLVLDGQRLTSPLLHTLRTAADCERIRTAAQAGQHVVMIGAGFISLELAAVLMQKGLKVTILEAQERILQRAVPTPIADMLYRAHLEQGVEIHLNSQLHSIHFHDLADVTFSTTANNIQHVQADWVLVGIGAIPNEELALTAGLEVDNGICVSETLQTSDPNIFAAGDVCRYPSPFSSQSPRGIRLESWRTAQEQGETAARNMLGASEHYQQAPWFWSDQYNLGLQSVGLSTPEHASVIRELGHQTALYFELDAEHHLRFACGIGVGLEIAKDIKLAERMINQGLRVDAQALLNPAISLKTLLKKEASPV